MIKPQNQVFYAIEPQIAFLNSVRNIDYNQFKNKIEKLIEVKN